MFIKWGIVLLGIGVLSACVVVPTGPNVMVLPASGKPFEAFQAVGLCAGSMRGFSSA